MNALLAFVASDRLRVEHQSCRLGNRLVDKLDPSFRVVDRVSCVKGTRAGKPTKSLTSDSGKEDAGEEEGLTRFALGRPALVLLSKHFSGLAPPAHEVLNLVRRHAGRNARDVDDSWRRASLLARLEQGLGRRREGERRQGLGRLVGHRGGGRACFGGGFCVGQGGC